MLEGVHGGARLAVGGFVAFGLGSIESRLAGTILPAHVLSVTDGLEDGGFLGPSEWLYVVERMESEIFLICVTGNAGRYASGTGGDENGHEKRESGSAADDVSRLVV